MLRKSILACFSLVLAFAAAASAQTNKLPPDLASLPEEIKTLQWQTIDPATLQPLEQARALLLMDHVISELSTNATSEADLMSAYIQEKNLGKDFASTPPPPPIKQLGYEDANKIAVALLRGPMSKSYYATEMADSQASSLGAYVQMYDRTCRRKWAEFDEARQQMRMMGSYLGNAQKLPDYDAWATAESARRQAAYEKQASANPGQPQNAAAQQPGQQPPAQQQNQQLAQAMGAAEYQQQQPAQSSQDSGSGQTQQTTAYATPAYPVYGGYGAYGASGAAAAGAYAGATAANNANDANKASTAQKAGAAAVANNNNGPGNAGAAGYHGSNSSWSHDASYNSNAHAQTQDRMSSFHGAPAGGSRGGGGRR
jgi:hypothetical protein